MKRRWEERRENQINHEHSSDLHSTRIRLRRNKSDLLWGHHVPKAVAGDYEESVSGRQPMVGDFRKGVEVRRRIVKVRHHVVAHVRVQVRNNIWIDMRREREGGREGGASYGFSYEPMSDHGQAGVRSLLTIHSPLKSDISESPERDELAQQTLVPDDGAAFARMFGQKTRHFRLVV